MKQTILGLALAAAVSIAPAYAASTQKLKIEAYNPGDKGIFAVSSEIISGPTEVVLIDAQFSTDDAKVLVDKIKSTGKKLTTVYISHSDPDYYFGLETIKAAFPDAKIIATLQTTAAIIQSKDSKLAYWGPILKKSSPKSIIVPEALAGDVITVDGEELKIIGIDGSSPDRTFIWIPSEKAVVGGIPVFANEHVWIADTQTKESRANWQKALASIEALKPELVIPGHYALNKDGSQPFTLDSVRFTRDYLDAFESEAAKAENSAALIEAIKKRYPGLKGEESLAISAKVIKGEMSWPAGEDLTL